MEIALITCGESARLSWSDDMAGRYDRVVAVNWASHWYDSDWVVAFDPLTWRLGQIRMPRIGSVSWGRPTDDVNAIRLENDLEWEMFEDIMEIKVKGKCSFTFPHAIEFCFAEWPDCSVDIYGLDMDGRRGLCEHFDDVAVDRSHSENRWLRERPFVEKAIHAHWDRIELIGCAFVPRIPRLPGDLK